jgi:hypothetical protein
VKGTLAHSTEHKDSSHSFLSSNKCIILADIIDVLLAVENKRIGNHILIDNMEVLGTDDDGYFFNNISLGNPVIGQEGPNQFGDNHFRGKKG